MNEFFYFAWAQRPSEIYLVPKDKVKEFYSYGLVGLGEDAEPEVITDLPQWIQQISRRKLYEDVGPCWHLPYVRLVRF